MIRALAVDDSRITLGFISSWIGQCNERIELECETESIKALTKLQQNDYDLLLLDLAMPEYDGIAILKELEQLGKLNEMKIIVITSNDGEAELKRCFELGASDYMVKPISSTVFTSRINAAVQEHLTKKKYKETIALMEEKNLQLSEMQFQLIDTQNQLIQNEQLNALGLLAAGMAHEINNPLGYLDNNVKVLTKYIKFLLAHITENNLSLDLTEPPQSGMSVGFINEDIDRISLESLEGIAKIESVIKELRSFSGIDQIDEKEMISIQDNMDAIIRMLFSEKRNQITIITNYQPNLSVELPVSRFNVALIEVLRNALESLLKSEKATKTVTIETWLDNNLLNVLVKDNGVGIPDYNINRIFQPFFTTKAEGEGAGLGLTTTRNIIVSQLKGKIDIYSLENEETTVLMSIPTLS